MATGLLRVFRGEGEEWSWEEAYPVLSLRWQEAAVHVYLSILVSEQPRVDIKIVLVDEDDEDDEQLRLTLDDVGDDEGGA